MKEEIVADIAQVFNMIFKSCLSNMLVLIAIPVITARISLAISTIFAIELYIKAFTKKLNIARNKNNNIELINLREPFGILPKERKVIQIIINITDRRSVIRIPISLIERISNRKGNNRMIKYIKPFTLYFFIKYRDMIKTTNEIIYVIFSPESFDSNVDTFQP
ncbi:hypothetical protein [Ureibacillus acetophenoni]